MEYNYLDDGITHINIYSKARTELGKWLSNFSYSPIKIENELFNSIEAYFYWLICKDDRLKLLYGYNAKKLGKEILKSIDREEPVDGNFNLYIKKPLILRLSLIEK